MQKNIVFRSLEQKKQYKYPYFLLGFYLTFLLSTVCLASKLTLVDGLLLPGGIFVFIFTFTMSQIFTQFFTGSVISLKLRVLQ